MNINYTQHFFSIFTQNKHLYKNNPQTKKNGGLNSKRTGKYSFFIHKQVVIISLKKYLSTC